MTRARFLQLFWRGPTAEPAPAQVLESNLDGFRFERAYIAGSEAEPRPVAIVGGVVCNIETEPGPLADGLAFCQPLNPAMAQDWPVNVLIEKDGHVDRRWSLTDDAGIVGAARRFAGLLAAGQARPGLALYGGLRL